MLHDYVAELINNRMAAGKYMAIVTRMEVSVNMLAMAVNLYRKIESMAAREMARALYRRKAGGSLFVRAGWSCMGRTASKEMPEHGCVETTVLQDLVSDPYRLLLACSMIAAKYCRDIPYANESWATVSNIRCATICEVERQILSILDYNLKLGGEEKILTEMKPYLHNEQGITRPEESRPVKIVRRIFCF